MGSQIWNALERSARSPHSGGGCTIPIMAYDENPYRATAPTPLRESPITEAPTTADFVQEVDDLVAFNSCSPFARKQLRRRWIAIGIFGAFLLFCLQGIGAELLLPIFVGVAIVAVLSSPPVIRRRVGKLYARIYQHRLPRQQTVVLAKEGLFVRTPDSENCYFWHGIERIDTTAKHAFFYLLSIQAVIVPARAFRSEAQFHAFVDHARMLWTNAKGGQPIGR